MSPSTSRSSDDNIIPSSGNCPCGSGKYFVACCRPLLAGQMPASSTEKLMRSRYTAYVVKDTAYILRTWHPSTRPEAIEKDTIPNWYKLQVIHSEQNEETCRGTVEFIAYAIICGKVFRMHEKSCFMREDGRWFYVDGEVKESTEKPGRNAPCPCGSGKKFKKCCDA